jgi:nudix-type nucleoside diphosphatase (YffH/AdpP family)
MTSVQVTGAPALCAAVLGTGPDREGRLAFFAEVMGLRAQGPEDAPVLDLGPGDDFSVELARLVMLAYGQLTPDRVRSRLGSLRVVADSRLRARQAPRADQRAGSGEVRIERQRPSHAGFFGLDVVDLSHRRFDGQMSPTLTREIFVAGDAVTVLPYDPLRDRVLLVEQFRTGPMGRGDPFPWQLEAIAGRIDPGESPEDAARREAEEEAGLTLGAMEKVAEYYPSPGAVAEYLYSYVALCELPDGCAGVFGAAEEAEDIKGHLVSFDRLLQLMAAGEIGNAPLLLTVLWLQRERARLRG